MSIITVEHVVKEFRLGQITTLRQSTRNAVNRVFGAPAKQRPLFRALDDVSFTVDKAEVVGIIGHNGAGKSTLLKLLANISQPTSGSVAIQGRLAPLIEVGAGFIHDFTGRENIFLNGAILGMSRKEVARKFDEIVDFTELEQFIDTPIKRYSSGMMVKLGFALATSVESDVLIVDEVLAVGDLAFQRKCFDRMEDLIKGRGRTVLLVSHNIRQVERMCSRVIMLDHGKICADGSPHDVTELFYRQSNERIAAYQKEGVARGNLKSSGEVDLVGIDIVDEHGQATEGILSGGVLRVRLRLAFNRPLKRPEFVVGTHTTDFFYLSASSTATLANPPDFDQGLHEIEYVVPNFPLVAGIYCIRCEVYDHNRRRLLAGENLATFSVLHSEVEATDPSVMHRLALPTLWQMDGIPYQPATKANGQPEVAR